MFPDSNDHYRESNIKYFTFLSVCCEETYNFVLQACARKRVQMQFIYIYMLLRNQVKEDMNLVRMHICYKYLNSSIQFCDAQRAITRYLDDAMHELLRT